MLDDLKYIHERDAQDALGIAEKQSQQLRYDFKVPDNESRPANVVFAGMGGSALAASLCTSWPGLELPFEICRNYTIPAYVGPQTLFIASSYSGNTEETLEALSHAEERGAFIAIITSGGKLADRAAEKNYPMAKLPSGYQPRHAVFAGFRALLDILGSYGLIEKHKVIEEVEKTAGFLDGAVKNWLPTVPTAQNQPKQVALEIAGKSPVIYGGPLMFPAAYKWKISFNENAKNVAWCNQIPEFNHNEFMGWSSHPVDKPYSVVILASSFEHSQVQKRFAVTERMLSGLWPSPIKIEAQGDTILQQLLWQVSLGDFVSLYTALLNGLNPTPVDLIERFKKELG